MLARVWEIPLLTPDKAYILGVVGPGDGWIETNGTIGLKSKDLDFVQKFKDCLEKVYGAHPKIYLTDKYHRVRFCSQYLVVNDILRYGELESFKEGGERVPTHIKKSNPTIKAAYLRGFFDSQGCAYLAKSRKRNSRIEAGKKRLFVLEEIRQLLLDLGIYSYIRKSGGRIFYRLAITGKMDLERFDAQIGFSIGRKQQKLNKIFGTYKNPSPYELDELISPMRIMRKVGFTYPEIGDVLRRSPSALWYKMKREFYQEPRNKGGI